MLVQSERKFIVGGKCYKYKIFTVIYDIDVEYTMYIHSLIKVSKRSPLISKGRH